MTHHIANIMELVGTSERGWSEAAQSACVLSQDDIADRKEWFKFKRREIKLDSKKAVGVG